MKELYNTPELTLISFVANEKLASFEFDDIQDGIFKDNNDLEPEASGIVNTP